MANPSFIKGLEIVQSMKCEWYELDTFQMKCLQQKLKIPTSWIEPSRRSDFTMWLRRKLSDAPKKQQVKVLKRHSRRTSDMTHFNKYSNLENASDTARILYASVEHQNWTRLLEPTTKKCFPCPPNSTRYRATIQQDMETGTITHQQSPFQ